MINQSESKTNFSLNKNINDLAHNLVRELAMSFKKVAIYGQGHPLAFKALEKPLLALQAVFHYKKYVNINVQKGSLYVLNMSVKETVFSTQLLHYLQLFDISALVIERSINAHHLSFFVEQLVHLGNQHNTDFDFSRALREKGCHEIEINAESGFLMFENARTYRGEFSGDYTLKRVVLDHLGSELIRLAEIHKAADEDLLKMNLDYTPEIIRYLIPERVSSLSVDQVKKELKELVDKMKDPSTENGEELASHYGTIFQLLSYHPDKDIIVEQCEDSPVVMEIEEHGEVAESGRIKVESQSRVDKYLDNLFLGDGSECDSSAFAEAFNRLLTTGQREKAFEVSARLVELLGSSDPHFRQKSLDLLLAVHETLRPELAFPIVTRLVDQTAAKVREGRETYEYSEFLWKLFAGCLEKREYDELVKLTSALAGRRHFENDVTIYDSMAVKKGLENINRREVIDTLVSELTQSKTEHSRQIREILVSIGSEEVALALASIISHPVRNVRQQSLKILAELGKASLKVFTQILVDDSNFTRAEGRHELADAKWYVIRNSIFVLGSLADREGIVPLRLRISDLDVRVRREIVSSLEKIGGDDAIDCLIYMAEDVDREISESAISGIGMIGDESSVMLLIDLLKRNCSESLRTVAALGKLGGGDAREFLCSLIENDAMLVQLAGGRVSREELRVSIVKALGQIGDSEALAKLRDYLDKQSSASKLLFRNSAVNKAITEVLARK